MYELSDVLELCDLMSTHGIIFWLDGGWAVDGLLGKQTRPHADVDIVIREMDTQFLRQLLESRGYSDVERSDTCPWNFVMGDKTGREVDFHVIVLDPMGNGQYGPKEKGVIFPAEALTGKAIIDQKLMPCISPQALVKFHTGYEPDENDFEDVFAICTRFGIELPAVYKRFHQE
jgi:lincosamide nucleotidyltransferase A/C/D/E